MIILLILTDPLINNTILVPVNLSPIIRELLLHKEKLVIPEFGTFSVIHHPAEISSKTNLLIPPSKEILFDPSRKSGDDSLAELIMKRAHVTKDEALEAIGSFIHGMENQVAARGSAFIEGLGNLTRNEAGSLNFEPLPELINLTGAFGLPRINIPAPKVAFTPPPPRKKIQWWIPAAAVLGLAGLFLVLRFTGVFKQDSRERTMDTIGGEQTTEPDRIVFGNRAGEYGDSSLESVSKQIDEHTDREKALMYEETEKTTDEKPAPAISRPAVPAPKPKPR
jgi:nucleoid DNA-binding protein